MLKHKEELDPLEIVKRLHREKRQRILQRQRQEVEVTKKRVEEAKIRQAEMVE